ncbi:hypothetical protein Dip510_000822 [Elusimicrobium posterum]|uniref:hypothetical protein n=1 Tax=Elusimicrobium posterum TaxID=3116653 RepID=UPI003C77AEFC
MPVNTTNTKHIYDTGNGVREWPFTFDVTDEKDIKIFTANKWGGHVREVLANFTVDLAGKKVIYPTEGEEPLPEDMRIVLIRVLALDQQAEFDQHNFDAKVLEKALDKTGMQIQQLQEEVNRSLKFSVADRPSTSNAIKTLRYLEYKAKQVEQNTGAAQTAAANAAGSAATAGAAAGTATLKAEEAAASANSAEGFKNTAGTAAVNASGSAAGAAGAAATATAKAGEAADSVTAAEGFKAAAENAAAHAFNSANSSATSATIANIKADEAAASASAAEGFKTAAETAAGKAEQSAGQASETLKYALDKRGDTMTGTLNINNGAGIVFRNSTGSTSRTFAVTDDLYLNGGGFSVVSGGIRLVSATANLLRNTANPDNVLWVSNKNIAGGVAGLDENAQVKKEQLQDILTSIDEESSRAQEAEELKIDKSILPSVITDVVVTGTESSVSIDKTTKDSSGGVETQTSMPLPVASESAHGVMSKESYKQINSNTAIINSFTGTPTYLTEKDFGVEVPSQEDFNNYAISQGYSQPLPNSLMVNNAFNGKEWVYNAFNKTWVLYGSTAVSTATNASLGIVKGDASTVGKVFVEQDGSLSVNGWDDLNAAITNEISERKAADDKKLNLTGGTLTGSVALNVPGGVSELSMSGANVQLKLQKTGRDPIYVAPQTPNGEDALLISHPVHIKGYKALTTETLKAGSNISLAQDESGNTVINSSGGNSGRNKGEVYFSQSPLAKDNAGGVMGWNGEYIVSSDAIWVEYYNWLKDEHPEFTTTKEEYDATLAALGEVKKYVVDEEDGSIRFPVYKIEKKQELIASGIENNIFYELYSDGKLIMWSSAPAAIGSPTFPLHFKDDMSYFITPTNIHNSTSGGSATYNDLSVWTAAIFVKTATGFSSRGSGFWMAEGYAAEDVLDGILEKYQNDGKLYPWIYVYNDAVPASMAQAAEFYTAISAKADKDLLNISPVGKEKIISLGMPKLAEGKEQIWNTKYKADSAREVFIYGVCSTAVFLQLSVWDENDNPVVVPTEGVGNPNALISLQSAGAQHLTASARIPKGYSYQGVSGASNQRIVYYPL